MAIKKISEEVIELRIEGADDVVKAYSKVTEEAQRAADGQEKAARDSASENERIFKKLIVARVASIKDRNRRELALLQVRHSEEKKRAKSAAADIKKLMLAQSIERSNLIRSQLDRDANIAEQAAAKSRASIMSAEGGLSKLQSRLVAAGGAAQVFEAGMRVAGTAMRALSQPIDLATTFEREFNLVRTLSDDVTESTRQNLLDLASRTPQTQIQIVRAAYDSLSRGIKEADLIGFLETASQAALAGNTDITTASNSLLKAFSAFGSQGETVASAADKIFKTTQKASTNFTELNASLGQGLAVASYGVKLEEVLAIAGNLTDKLGISFSEAIVRTNGLINVVTGSTDKNRKAFKALGVEYGISAIKSKGLAAVLNDIRVKSRGSAEELAKLSGNKRAREGLLGTLAGENYKEFSKFLDETTNSTNGLGYAFSKVQGDAKSAQDQFTSLRESVLRDLGDVVLPQLNSVMQELGDYMKDNRGEIVETFKEVSAAVLTLGQFLVTNGDRILMLMGGIFATKQVGAFSTAVGGAVGSLTKLGPKTGGGILKGIAKGLQFAPGLGLIATAGLVIYDVLKDNFFDRAEKDAKNLQKQIAKLQEQAAKDAGFSSRSSRVKTLEKVRQGELLGFGATNKADFVTPQQFISKQKGDAAERDIALSDRVDQEVKERLKKAEQLRKDAIKVNKKIAGLDIKSSTFVEQRAKTVRWRLESEEIIKGVERLRALADRASADFSEAEQNKTQAKQIEIAKVASKKEQARRKREQAQRARLDASYQDRIAKSELAQIKDKDDRAIASMVARHQKEVVLSEKHGSDMLMLFRAQDAEETALRDKIAEGKRKAAEENRKAQLEKDRTSESVGRDYAFSLAVARGSDPEVVDFAKTQLEQTDKDQTELERFRSHGLATEELEKEILRRREARYLQFQANRQKAEADVAANVASSMGTLMSSVKALGQAVGASESTIGKLEALVLISRAAFHTAAGFGEIANAKTAAVGRWPWFKPNPLAASGHYIASAAHFTAAGVATIQAGVSMAGGGGGGGSASAAPAASAVAPRTGQNQMRMESREPQPAIQFGDIHLSSIPSMLSREGASEMGKLIAKDVAKELRQRANIQGTSRLPSRVIRRS